MFKKLEEIKSQINLILSYKPVILGRIYITALNDSNGDILYRSFEGILSKKEVLIYAEIVEGFIDWVLSSNLTDHIYVEEPQFIGDNYLELPYADHRYFRSIVGIKDEIEEFEEEGKFDTELHKWMEGYNDKFERMRGFYDNLADKGKEKVLKDVIQRSVFQASETTYYDDEEQRIIVLDPKIEMKDILAWT